MGQLGATRGNSAKVGGYANVCPPQWIPHRYQIQLCVCVCLTRTQVNEDKQYTHLHFGIQ